MLDITADQSEADLIFRAKQGDRDAFGGLVRRNYSRVVRVVIRMCEDTAMAEDAAQDAFLRAWINLPSYRPTYSPQSWLSRIAINAVLDVLRRRPDQGLETEGSLPHGEMPPDPETAVIQAERSTLVRQAIRSLPEGAQIVLVLREYGELSYREIASVLNIPVGTVMSRLNCARGRLRAILRASASGIEDADG